MERIDGDGARRSGAPQGRRVVELRSPSRAHAERRLLAPELKKAKATLWSS
jgi:hypothetical protein